MKILKLILAAAGIAAGAVAVWWLYQILYMAWLILTVRW